MIVTTLMGGLGNQLFQYAVGRAVALRTGRRLALEATLLPSPSGSGLRRFGLGELAVPSEVRVIRRPGRNGLRVPPSQSALRIRRVVRSSLARSTVIEPTDRHVFVDLSAPPRRLAILFGFWQSHRYHVGFEEVLRHELTPRIDRDGRVHRLLAEVGDHELVAVHVRRGDYVTDPRIAAAFGSLSADYYRRALASVLERCERPMVVVLSDDPVWAEAHVTPDAPTLHPELERPFDAVEVLAAMSRSRHAVIANSSLSWWGARLAAHRDQLVVAPERWFADGEADPDLRLPPEWTRLT